MSPPRQTQEFSRVFVNCIAFAALGLIPASIADLKQKNFWKWWLFGSLLFIIALPAAIIAKENPTPSPDSPSPGEQFADKPRQRPVALTILVIIYLVLMVGATIITVTDPNATKPDLRWEIFIRVIWIIALFGVWLMRKWGLYLFFYQALFIDAFLYIYRNESTITYGWLLTAVFCIVGFIHFKQMK
jgi:hypothetical protein